MENFIFCALFMLALYKNILNILKEHLYFCLGSAGIWGCTYRRAPIPRLTYSYFSMKNFEVLRQLKLQKRIKINKSYDNTIMS